MLPPGQELALRRAVALALIGNDHPWPGLTALEELAEECLGGGLVATTWDEHLEDVAVLIPRPPPIGPLLGKAAAHLSQVPLITRPRPPAAEVMRLRWAAFPPPLAEGFRGHHEATAKPEGCDVTRAERKAERQPDGVADDLPREPGVFRERGRGGGRHGSAAPDDDWGRRAHAALQELCG